MAHEITVRENGVAEAAFALTPAWHGLGTVVDHAMSAEEALELAHLNWDVVARPIAYQPIDLGVEDVELADGYVPPVYPRPKPTWKEWQGNVMNVRSDNGFELGVVRSSYQIVQNREAIAFMDALVGEGMIRFESAFSLSGGKRVVITAKLPEVDEIVEGDLSERYMLIGLSHDATSAVKFGTTATRVVCANTYAVALGEGGVRELSIYHKGDINDQLDRAREILLQANEKFDDYASSARELAGHSMTGEEWAVFLDVMCPVPTKVDPEWTQYREDQILATRGAIAENYRADRRQLMDGVRGTAWAAFNAVTQHIDHLPRMGATPQRKAEARFNVTQYGPGRDQKERAFQALRRIMAG